MLQVFEKISFNALDVEQLLNVIKDSGAKQIVVWGIETHICVHQNMQKIREDLRA